MVLFIALFWCLSASSFALETDQYVTWNQDLNDVIVDLNEMMNNEVLDYLAYVNSQDQIKQQTCHQLVPGLMQNFRSQLSRKFEKWLFDNPRIDRFPGPDVNTFDYFRMSIYATFTFPYFLPLSKSIKANGVYFGTDKLTHFASFGKYYYVTYHEAREQGLAHDDALIKAIWKGIESEQGITGHFSTGVFSYGDLEANFQGFLFAQRLCHGDEPYLQKDEQQAWQLKNPILMEDYINPLWDESFNSSTYTEGRRKGVFERFESFCGAYASVNTVSRLSEYETIGFESYSSRYLKKLQAEGTLPKQDLESIGNVCALEKES